MPQTDLAYYINSSDRFLSAIPSIEKNLKEKMLKIEHRRLKEDQDLFVVAGQIYSVDLHPIDSWTFFRWLQDHQLPSRYIIRKDSKFYQRIKANGQTQDVITVSNDCLHGELLNLEDIWVRAKAFFVEWRTDSIVDLWMQHLKGCRYVFIGHGIIGTCFTDHLKTVVENEYNDLNVSSEIEKRLIGVNPQVLEKCFIAGLPRYDLLKSVVTTEEEAQKTIFVMFTWRLSLNNEQLKMEDSAYFKGLMELLSPDGIIQQCLDDNVRFVFAPHHAINHLFDTNPIKNVEIVKSQEDVAYWIRHAHMLITDFSSVSYDFFFQEKPVIYWIPDKNDKNLNELDRIKISSALELRKKFFNTVDTLEEVQKLVIHYLKNNFVLEDDYKKIAAQHFAYRTNFCQRLYETINERISNNSPQSTKPINSKHMSPKFSIIIPVYNAEKYLSTCLESVIRQNENDFEVIIVNDGSTDCSYQICEKYAFIDNRIILVNQSNAGVSAARNKGIEMAQGTYITFIDADDWINPDYLTVLENTYPDSDLLFFGNIHHHQDGTSHAYSPGNRIAYEQKEREELLLQMAKNDCWYEFYGYTWNKRFKREIIEKNHIRFQEGLSLREDELFTDFYVRHASSISSIDQCIYNYRFSYGGLTYRFHPGTELLLLARGIQKANHDILNRQFYAYKKSKFFHYLFSATTNLHTKESLAIFEELYSFYYEFADFLLKDDNPFLNRRCQRRYRRIFSHPRWLSRLIYLGKRKLMKKKYRGV